jgi:hypothetical protein
MNTNYIILKLFSISNWQDEDLQSLVLLLDSYDVFRPDRWGPYEPMKFKFSKNEMDNIQARWKTGPGLGLMFGKQNSRFSLSIDKNLHIKRPNVITVFLEDEFFIEEEQAEVFLNFAKQLFEWGNVIYGYACHRLDFERKNKLPIPTRIEGKLIATGGMDIRHSLPGVYWANFFGSQYIDWFGKNIFNTVPSYTQTDLPNNGRLLLTSATPLDYVDNAVLARELALKKHLGGDAFFNVQDPTAATISPFNDGFFKID